jgi:hypothetical protein
MIEGSTAIEIDAQQQIYHQSQSGRVVLTTMIDEQVGSKSSARTRAPPAAADLGPFSRGSQSSVRRLFPGEWPCFAPKGLSAEPVLVWTFSPADRKKSLTNISGKRCDHDEGESRTVLCGTRFVREKVHACSLNAKIRDLRSLIIIMQLRLCATLERSERLLVTDHSVSTAFPELTATAALRVPT